ncbi:hypothetical protein ILYODFUR_024257 [Ilyodon furcidens]|uniref:Uncharacterized protein n=1 Tax=Ilyodon furcidens TaxID=33524 RepID=A0ABV0TL77_9TELE
MRSKRNPRTHTKMGQTHPARGPRTVASTGIPHHTPRNHTNTPHHHHCNDSPGRNIIQLSSTIAAQPIQMPVTPHTRRGHNPPIPHAAPDVTPESHQNPTPVGATAPNARPPTDPSPGTP